MKHLLITLTVIISALILSQKAIANSLECDKAIEDTNFIYQLMEDHVYLEWAMRNDPSQTRAQVKVINNQARSLNKYCKISKPRASQVNVRMNMINNAWDKIKKLSI